VSVVKFVGEQKEDHGGRLHWPGAGGLPVRGPGMTVSQDEYDSGFAEVRDFHRKTFNLAVPEQDEQYHQVMDRIVNGWYVKIFIERYRHTVTDEWMVYLEWAQRYSQLESPRTDALKSIIQNAG
jgi:hypothetical protein